MIELIKELLQDLLFLEEVSIMFQFLILALAVGCIALTLSRSSLFGSFRNWVISKSHFFGELIICPYCTAHWVTLMAMLICRQEFLIDTGTFLVDFFVTWFALTSLSAIVAGLISKLFAEASSAGPLTPPEE